MAGLLQRPGALETIALADLVELLAFVRAEMEEGERAGVARTQGGPTGPGALGLGGASGPPDPSRRYARRKGVYELRQSRLNRRVSSVDSPNRERSRNMKRLSAYVVILLVVLIAAGPAASANSSGTAVFSPNARVVGLTRAKWSAIFFQSIFAIPAPENPGVGAPWTKCYVDSIDRAGMGVAFFLPSGTFTCEMPRGMTLIQPVIRIRVLYARGAPPHAIGGTPEELRACAQQGRPGRCAGDHRWI